MEITNIPSLEDAKKYIDAIDFSNIIDKLLKQHGWRKKDALRICQLYRNFLFLQKKYSHQHNLPPSEEVDEFWHNHILDTKKYREDCLAIFGKYFDHYPYFGIDGTTDFNDLENAFNMMQTLHHHEFGEYIYEVRNFYAKTISFFKRCFKQKPRRSELSTL